MVGPQKEVFKDKRLVTLNHGCFLQVVKSLFAPEEMNVPLSEIQEGELRAGPPSEVDLDKCDVCGPHYLLLWGAVVQKGGVCSI